MNEGRSSPTAETAPSIWVLADDRAGNVSQCLGIANALGLPFSVKQIRYTAAGRLPNAVMGASLAGLTTESRAVVTPPWPDLVIAAGRRTGPVARAIKQRNEGHTFLVQSMHPGMLGAAEFDLIAVPRHDRRKLADNLLEVIGAPHGVTPARLEEASKVWSVPFVELPSPRIAVIVGGSTRRHQFTEAMAAELGRMVSAAAAEISGSLLVTTSRRTGRAPTAALMATLTVPHRVHRWGDAGDNPYMGILALADIVVVTGDSVSMCSEACATPAPVYIFAPTDLVSDKHARLHQDLVTSGCARLLEGRMERWNHPPLNAATAIAAALRNRLLLPDPLPPNSAACHQAT